MQNGVKFCGCASGVTFLSSLFNFENLSVKDYLECEVWKLHMYFSCVIYVKLDK